MTSSRYTELPAVADRDGVDWGDVLERVRQYLAGACSFAVLEACFVRVTWDTERSSYRTMPAGTLAATKRLDAAIRDYGDGRSTAGTFERQLALWLK